MVTNYNDPQLSVIVPNYNNAQYLEDCIGSILEQTFSDYEIIICDDCSTDGSVEIIKNYANNFSNIRAIFHQKNIGVAKNRHSGIVRAKGEYFTVLDADDIFFDKRKLQKEMEVVKRFWENHNERVCGFSKIAILDDDLNYLRDQWPDEMIREGNIFNEIYSRAYMIPRDFIVATKSYFAVGKYDKKCQPYEDWDLKIRLAKRCNFFYSGIYGTGYRRNGKGLSYISFSKHIKILKKVYKKNYELIEPKDKKIIKTQFKKYLNSLRKKQIRQLKNKLNATNLNYIIFFIPIHVKILSIKLLILAD